MIRVGYVVIDYEFKIFQVSSHISELHLLTHQQLIAGGLEKLDDSPGVMTFEDEEAPLSHRQALLNAGHSEKQGSCTWRVGLQLHSTASAACRLPQGGPLSNDCRQNVRNQ